MRNPWIFAQSIDRYFAQDNPWIAQNPYFAHNIDNGTQRYNNIIERVQFLSAKLYSIVY